MAIILEVLQYGSVCYGDYLDEQLAHHFMISKEEVYWEQTLFFTTQTWPFMPQLNQMILMQSESGIGGVWEHRESQRLLNPEIQHRLVENGKPSDDGAPVRLSIEHIIGALLFWAIGCISSFIVFVAELITKRRRRTNTYKEN